MRRPFRTVAGLLVALLAGCSNPTEPSATPPASLSGPPGSPRGVPIGELGNVNLEQLRQALLGEPPYPSGWEEQVDQLIASVEPLLDSIRVPDVEGMDARTASCTVWQPLVGNVDWATGAFLERQYFIAHLGVLVRVAPGEILEAADEALRVAAAAAAEQMMTDGDIEVISRIPRDAVRTIGLWAVDSCLLPVEPDTAPGTEGWTEEEIQQSCEWDRDRLEDAQEKYRAGPGNGAYAEHPHVLEVTIFTFAYPGWHRLAEVDNDADPPTFEVEPIPGAFCDR